MSPWQEHLLWLRAALIRSRRLERTRDGGGGEPEILFAEGEPCGATPDGNSSCRLPYGHEGEHRYGSRSL